MNDTDRTGRLPLSPKEGWISDGRQVLHFKPRRYDRWGQALEVTLGELMPSREPPLLKRRRELMRNEAIKLWAQKRRAAGRSANRSGRRHYCAGPEPLQATKQSHLAPICSQKQCV